MKRMKYMNECDDGRLRRLLLKCDKAENSANISKDFIPSQVRNRSESMLHKRVDRNLLDMEGWMHEWCVLAEI